VLVKLSLEPGRAVKKAETRRERERLAAEAGILAAAAHPGVVRLVDVIGGSPPTALVLGRIDGPALSELGRRLDWAEVAGLGAALATTVADLHELGVVHGSVRAEHVLLDEAGRPVLCGFGAAMLCKDIEEAGARAPFDVDAMVRLLLALAEGSPPRPLAGVLTSLSRGLTRGRPPTARRLARQLVRAVPEARFPSLPPAPRSLADVDSRPANERPDVVPTVPCETGPERPVTRTAPRTATDRRRRGAGRLISYCVPAAGLALAIATAVGSAAGSRVSPHSFASLSDRPIASGSASIGCPSVTATCAARAVQPGSVLVAPPGRFMLVGSSGLEVIGRWSCGAEATPAVLDIATGSVWVFRHWPTDPNGISGDFVGKVSFAEGLRAIPRTSHGLACDDLEVTRRDRAAVTVHLSRQ
jgi:hypothetical protein